LCIKHQFPHQLREAVLIHLEKILGGLPAGWLVLLVSLMEIREPTSLDGFLD
jgi:hypothetical protein